ncbi:S4 domain-containing protein, partial [Pseudomonas otitidis]
RGATLIDLLLDAGLQPSRGAARRLAAGGGVRLDGVEVRDLDAPLPADAQGWTLSLGKKRHYAIRVTRG